MNEADSPRKYEDVRRAGLNPAADYGGDVTWRSAGNDAIRETREQGVAASNTDSEVGQMSFLGADVEVKPEFQQATEIAKARIGSMALSPEELTAMPTPDIKVDRLGYDNPNYSRGANQRQQQADQAAIRAQIRRTRGK